MPWPKGRKRPGQSERMRKRHADPAFKAAHAERAAERMRKRHADPVFRAKLVAAVRRHFGGDPDELPDYGRAEYYAAREEGFGHADAMKIALDALAMLEAEEAA